MMNRELAECLFAAARVLNNHQYGREQRPALDALLRYAKTDKERHMAPEKLALLVVERGLARCKTPDKAYTASAG